MEIINMVLQGCIGTGARFLRGEGPLETLPFILAVAFLIIGATALMGCDNPSDTAQSRTNVAPTTVESLSASTTSVAVDGIVELTCRVSNLNGGALTYTWNASHGTITPQNETAMWHAPATPVTANVSVSIANGQGTAQTKQIEVTTHVNSPSRILVDASREGGVWWFPQSEGTGFSPTQPHQGKALADYMRGRGFQVDELPRTATITDSLLNQYDKVIIASSYYSTEADIQKYLRFIQRSTSLMLIGEYLRGGGRNPLAERLGIRFAGIAYGPVTRYAQHAITLGATPFYFNAGAVIMDTTSNPSIEFLGWLSDTSYVDLNDNGVRDPNEPTGMPVMGILHHPKSKIFFLGEINGIEMVPQPLVRNLVTWAF